MTTDNLKQTLLLLHAALEKAGPLDSELLQLLKILDDDIHNKLVIHTAAAQDARRPDGVALQPAVPDDAGLTSRAQALSARFAAQHPHLEPVLRELTDTLQRIGI